MTRRWLADEVAGDRAALTGSHARHLVRVLRARVGQEFDIVTSVGVRRGVVSSIDDAGNRVEFDLGAEVAAATLPRVTVVLSIFKFDRMEWAIEKCTELGAAAIVAVIAQRTDAHLATTAFRRMDRWQRIARQAAEQSRRAMPPEVAAPIRLKEAVARPAGTRIVLAESEQELKLKDAVASHSPGAEVLLALGPEGGWAPPELQSFRAAGWKMASLGGTILRAETAAIAALAIVMSELQ